MKKLLITLAAATILASGAFAQSFPDIPEGHWAGDAVERIADLNIVIGFPDGTFRGNEAFTRYQAALVISRMLDVINANMDSAMAMTEEDLASLRNAVQELAADVAAQGVRLSAAEGAIAGLSDDTVVNADRIAELEAMLDGLEMEPGIDPAVLRDLQNQVASLRVATDTAQATADTAQAAADAAQATADEALAAAGDAQDAAAGAQSAAGDAMSAAEAAQQTANGAQATAEVAQATADQANSRANAAASTAEANASEIAALNDLIQILGDQIEELQAMSGQMDAASADALTAVEGDIANIREFVILLRRDQVAIRDRVSALEASDDQQTADIADLQARVTQLETNPLGISGSIELEYFVGRTDGAGDEFDIDRAYGVGMMRDIGQSTFSSGTDSEVGLDPDQDEDEVDDVGEFAEDRGDIEYGSGFESSITIELGPSSEFDGEGSPRGLNSFEAVITLSIEETAIDLVDDDDDVPGADATGYVWFVDDFTATFDPIGAAPLTFAFGKEVTGSFTPYTLNREDVGFVASVGSPEFLAFLDPSLQVAYLTSDDDDAQLPEANVTTGIRGTLSPIDGVTGGFSFVRHAEGTADKDDVNDDNANDMIWGLDAQATLGPVTIQGEYANGDANDGGYTEDVMFVTAEAGLDILGGVDLSANYRDIALGWEGAFGAPALLDADDFPFEEDQVGFGAELGFGLFIFDLGVFVDSYSIDAGDEVFAFGVDATANLFRAFSVGGFYESVSIDGNTVATNDGAPERDNEYDTKFGATLEHDGSADNALVPNLNLLFGYEQAFEDVTGEYSQTTITAEADYTLEVSIVSLSPYVSYEMVDNDPANEDSTELMVGTSLMTQPLDVFLQPSLEAAVNYRQASYSEGADPDYDADQLQWAVGLNLGEFLLPYSSLSARYASYTGTNVYWDVNGPLDERLSEGDVDRGGIQGQVSGFEVEWNYYDLMFAYGIYDNDPNTDVDDDETGAQAFRVSYEVAF